LVMWAVDTTVATKAAQAAPRLESELAGFGLTMKDFSVINRTRPQQAADGAAPGSIVNLQA